jgi:hypothetical protein
VVVDLAGRTRLSTPVVQILLAAARDGVALHLQGASPGVMAGLQALGVDAAFRLEEVAAWRSGCSPLTIRAPCATSSASRSKAQA